MGHTLYNKWALNRKSSLLPQVTRKPHSHLAWWGDMTGAICLEEGWEVNCTLVAIFPYFWLLSSNYPWSVLHPFPPQTSQSRNLKYKVIDARRLKSIQSCQTTHKNNMKKIRSPEREEVGVKGVGALCKVPLPLGTFTPVSPLQLQIPQKKFFF